LFIIRFAIKAADAPINSEQLIVNIFFQHWQKDAPTVPAFASDLNKFYVFN